MTFNSVIVVMMFLCFFSLSANMSGSILEQQKEIAVLRSIGVTNLKIRLLFFYEALVLVLSACMLGVVTGLVIGYTMSKQEELFTNNTTAINLKYKQFCLIIALSILLAFLATFGPAT